MRNFYVLLFFIVAYITNVQSQVVCTFNIPDTGSCSSSPTIIAIPIGFTRVLWDDGDTTPTNAISTPGIHWARVTVIDTTSVNLVVNGDFEAGRTGFTSGYSVGVPGSSSWGLLGNPGTYEILSSPRDGHVNFFTCTDVTPAPGTQMLVANGSTSATDVWCQTITVVPNTNYIFSAWVTNVLNDASVAQLQFKINGSVIGTPFSTTPIGCQWRQFSAIWNSGISTSANICIRNLNTGGGGNDFAIDEIRFSNICVFTDTFRYSIYSATSDTITDTTCFNNPIVFNGISLNTSGFYRDTLRNVNGCDSFLTLDLRVLPISYYSYNATICANQYYLFNGVNLSSSGTYNDTLLNYVGCDSFLTLNLTVNPIDSATINSSICSNQTYLFNGVLLNTPGIYKDTLVSYLGCDSFITLVLDVRPTSTSTINQTICSNEFYLFNGVNLNTTGIYLDTFINSVSCDSVVTLNLTVNPTSSSRLDTFICFGEQYLFDGMYLNSTGIYYDTLTNYLGCDSVRRLNLTAFPLQTGTINTSICSNQNYLFNGVQRNISGTYLDTIVSLFGCDSFITLNLLVRNTSTYTYGDSICDGDHVVFNGITHTSSGTFLDTILNSAGCDSFIIFNLTVFPNPTVIINGGNDTLLMPGQSLFLRATGANTYVWNNGNNLAFQTITPTESSSYYVIGTDTNGCVDDDSILVILSDKVDSTKIAIPSAFSPNGDGINDILRILATYNITIDEWVIFNRWGELVFSGTGYESFWDGTFRGREQPQGTYVYYIKGRSKTSQNTIMYHGNVTLLR